MSAISDWISGKLHVFQPTRVDAIPVAECNLRCKHCLWPHNIQSPDDSIREGNIEKIKQWGVPIVYAGRILSPRGERFIEACFSQGLSVGIVDNGYTIWRREDFLPQYSHINISLDGNTQANDYQRQKTGAFDAAWHTILRLKTMGYDPIVSTAFSPRSFEGWSEFERLLRDWDVPMSATLVLDYPETVKRQMTFPDKESLREGFDVLLSGIPKLINLYDLEFVRSLHDILNDFEWAPSDTGDSLETRTPNGSKVIYYPESVITMSNPILKWDGRFYTPWEKEFLPLESIGEQSQKIHALNMRELKIWRELL